MSGAVGDIERTLGQLAQRTGGRLIGPDRPFDSVSTDSRTLQPGALFVALRGPNFDGGDFVAAAAQRGAAGALVERELAVDLPQVLVTDALAALSRFARDWRRQFAIPVIGVTGSNGKTTTKELIAAILTRSAATHITRGNLNNHIGVPLTLLQMSSAHRYAVIEMGANHAGEIAHLASLVEPTVGVVTNAGPAHLEGFGSVEGVAHAKGELFRALPEQGVAVINADDAYADFWRETRAAERVVTFGFEQPADFTAHNVRVNGAPTSAAVSGAGAGWGRIEFDLVTPFGTRPAAISLVGLHNLRNALAAAAAACAAGCKLDDVVAGLAELRSVAARLELKPAINGAFVVDDSYNANPGSLKAGLDALRSFHGARWLVLGEMKELGEGAGEMHAQVGRYARETGVERLLAVGEGARSAVEAFGPGARWFADVDALIAEARATLARQVVVLIKGSRANRLERVAAALTCAPPADPNGRTAGRAQVRKDEQGQAGPSSPAQK
ncbi:MAG TPA: UDP-N-acetylmuramoyl-tripeptide--D-alanyl-D-alanine ligase, partial [Steroidobacter sp.]|nr:UDP-N-acetylmuramoyl-tripeptide--D-alanyl-D-alanine ligase [Steroidobacter sp.]